MKSKTSSALNLQLSPLKKLATSSASARLTNSELELLLRRKSEIDAYARKAFTATKPKAA
jgi:hypothetical protein